MPLIWLALAGAGGWYLYQRGVAKRTSTGTQVPSTTTATTVAPAPASTATRPPASPGPSGAPWEDALRGASDIAGGFLDIIDR